jgi:hypothetical protein
MSMRQKYITESSQMKDKAMAKTPQEKAQEIANALNKALLLVQMPYRGGTSADNLEEVNQIITKHLQPTPTAPIAATVRCICPTVMDGPNYSLQYHDDCPKHGKKAPIAAPIYDEVEESIVQPTAAQTEKPSHDGVGLCPKCGGFMTDAKFHKCPAEQVDAARCPKCGDSRLGIDFTLSGGLHVKCSGCRYIFRPCSMQAFAQFFRAASLKQETQPPTRFAEFDDADHPCHKWWEEHGQYMMSGGGRREFIWACRGWIAREQLAEGVEVTGETEAASSPLETPAAVPEKCWGSPDPGGVCLADNDLNCPVHGSFRRGAIAQSVEHPAHNRECAGSIPAGPTTPAPADTGADKPNEFCSFCFGLGRSVVEGTNGTEPCCCTKLPSTGDTPQPQEKPDILERLKSACNGHPHAKIAWPHYLLHDAMAEISKLRTPAATGKTPDALSFTVTFSGGNNPKLLRSAAEIMRGAVLRERPFLQTIAASTFKCAIEVSELAATLPAREEKEK